MTTGWTGRLGGGRSILTTAGALGGMAWAAIVALLRDRFNASEILVSLMLVYVAEMVLGYLVYGPWKDPAGYNFPQTRTFEVATLVPKLMVGSRAHAGLLIALLGVLLHASAGYVLSPVLLGSVVLVLIAVAYHRLRPSSGPYPHHWL